MAFLRIFMRVDVLRLSHDTAQAARHARQIA
jgi:hypothetical protein